MQYKIEVDQTPLILEPSKLMLYSIRLCQVFYSMEQSWLSDQSLVTNWNLDLWLEPPKIPSNRQFSNTQKWYR